MADWFAQLGNSILIFIDGFIYGFIYICYKLIMCLANIQIFGDGGAFDEFAKRIYVLLGIFMIFRLGFSVLQYIIDPDKATDKSVGAGKLLTNCVVSLVLLVTAPFLFTQLYNLQTAILSDNILGNLVFGKDIVYSGDSEEKTIESIAKDTQFLLFGAFFQVNTDVVTECATSENGERTAVLGSIGMARNSACLEKVNDLLSSAGSSVNEFYYTGTNVNEDTRKFSSFQNVVNLSTDGQSVFNYHGIISTVTGIFVIFILLGFCLDVAVRVFYLGFLQIISPIPIISYMDPKQTFSNGIFSNWLKEVGKTFLSLFIRLGAIFLAIYFIQIISDRILAFGETDLYNNNPMCENCGEMNPWIYVMLIIGAFLFARKVPQYIETIFGFKSDGGMFKNVAAAAGAGIGFGIGGIASAAAGAMTAKTYGQNAVTAALSSGVKGAVGGAWSGRKWDGKSVGGLISPGLKTSGNLARYQGAKVGTTFPQRAAGITRNLIGAPQKGEELKERVSRAKEFNDTFDRTDQMLLSKLKKIGVGGPNNVFTDDEDFNKIQTYNKLRTRLEAARARGEFNTIHEIEEGKFTFKDDDGQIYSMTKRFDDYEDDAKDILFMATERDENGNYSKLKNSVFKEGEEDHDLLRIISSRDLLDEIAKNNSMLEEFKDVKGAKTGEVTKGKKFGAVKKENKKVETARIKTESSDDYVSAAYVNRAVQADNRFDFINKR